MFEDYIEKLANNKEIYLKVKVLPNAPKTAFMEKMSDGTIKISLAAQPEKDKANLALVKFLATELKIRKYQVQIVSGTTDRTKLIKISR